MWHIFGSNGYIGTKFCKYIVDKYDNIKYTIDGSDSTIKFNLEEINDSIFDNINKNDFVIFLMAISSPDICNNDYEYAYKINVEYTSFFIDKCLKKEANVLFFSSDTVNGSTDGKSNNENAICIPFGNYAKMKYEVEQKFKRKKRFKVFRLSYVYSKDDKFAQYLDSCCESNKIAEVYDGLFRNVIYIRDVFDAMINLSNNFQKYRNHIFNISGTELLSRSDLANIYKNNINNKLRFEIIPTPKTILEARPNEIFTKSLYLEKLLGRKPIQIKNINKEKML